MEHFVRSYFVKKIASIWTIIVGLKIFMEFIFSHAYFDNELRTHVEKASINPRESLTLSNDPLPLF